MKKKKAIHCKNEQEAEQITKILDGKGFNVENDTFRFFNVKTCYIIKANNVTFSPIDYCFVNNYKIIPASKYIKKHAKKQLLKQVKEANEAITPQPHSGLDLDTVIDWPKREVILNTYLTETQQELWPAFEALCEVVEIYRKIDLPEQEKDYPIYTPMFLYNGGTLAIRGWNLVYKILQFPNMDTCDEFIKENKELLEKAKPLL